MVILYEQYVHGKQHEIDPKHNLLKVTIIYRSISQRVKCCSCLLAMLLYMIQKAIPAAIPNAAHPNLQLAFCPC